MWYGLAWISIVKYTMVQCDIDLSMDHGIIYTMDQCCDMD